MLRNFTAALIATALIAGPALAAQPSSNAGAAPAASVVAAAPAAPANIKGQNAIKQTDARKPVKPVKHARIQARAQARAHVRHARTYGHHHVVHVTKHLAKPGKVTKTNKTVKSSA
jgi:hypothetical protein